jgi:hemerythrin-like domain-containing protein
MGSPMNGMRYAHKTIRKELAAMEAAAGMLGAMDVGDAARLAERVALFKLAIKGHNAGEEAVLWPAIDAIFPQISIPYTLDHRADDETIESIERLLSEYRAAGSDALRHDVAGRVHRQMIALNVSISHHATKEDNHLVPLVEDQFSLEQQHALDGGMGAHSPGELMGQIVPMMVRALDPEEQVDYVGKMARTMPPEVFRAAAGWIKAGVNTEVWTALIGRVPELGAVGR